MKTELLDRPETADEILALAWRVGRAHQQWVPYYLRPDRRRVLLREYAYFSGRGVEARTFGLRDGATLVATATAYVDPPLQSHLGRRVGLLGQFESLPGVDLAPMLADAHEWLAARGVGEVWAPANCPFQIEGGGTLTEGGERSCPFLSHWTPPYYREAWERAGYRPIQGYHNYVVDLAAPGLEERLAAHRRHAESHRVTFRPAERARFDREIRLIAELYNATFDRHWGHGPIAVEEFAQMTESLRDVAEPSMIVFAERDGRTVGVRVAFPQLEPVFRVLDGELRWWKYPRLPFALRRVRDGISLLVGVLPEARGLGIAPALSACVYDAMRRRGYRTVTHTAIFDDNVNSQRQVGKVGGVRGQGWSIYGRSL